MSQRQDWWRLPGPAGFLGTLVRAVREGSSVLLRLPLHPPEGAERAVRQALEDDVRQWLQLSVPADSDVSPGGYLQPLLCPDMPPDALPSARTLAQTEAFAGRIIWLDGLTPQTWPRWRLFLSEYASASRPFNEWERTVLIVPLGFRPEPAPPPDDLTLITAELEGTVSPLDMQLYASVLLRARPMLDLHRRLAIATITRLAAWDPWLADMLADDPLTACADPYPVLSRFAAVRGWTRDTPASSDHGTAAPMAGATTPHSAWLNAAGGNAELSRRLWSAQTEVLFPLLEQRRQGILSELDGQLVIPFRTRFGEITDVSDLELGHLEAQVYFKGVQAPAAIRTELPVLREVRNYLAHLTPVPAHLLLSSVLEASLNGLW